MLEAAQRDCEAHAVDWRTRSIADRAAREAAESSLAARDALIASMEAAAVERVSFLGRQMKRAEAAESERDALCAALNTAHSDIRDLFTAIGEACRAVMGDIDLTMADGEGGNGARTRIEDAIRKLSRTALRKPDAPDAGRRGEAP